MKTCCSTKLHKFDLAQAGFAVGLITIPDKDGVQLSSHFKDNGLVLKAGIIDHCLWS